MPHMLLERQTFYFSFNKNRELKIKLGRVETCEREKSAFFLTFIFPQGNFCSVCISFYFISLNKLSEFMYIYVLLHTKNITLSAFLLAFKIIKSLQCILNSCVSSATATKNYNNYFQSLIDGLKSGFLRKYN